MTVYWQQCSTPGALIVAALVTSGNIQDMVRHNFLLGIYSAFGSAPLASVHHLAHMNNCGACNW